MFHSADLDHSQLLTAALIAAGILIALLLAKGIMQSVTARLPLAGSWQSLAAAMCRKTRIWFLATLALRITADFSGLNARVVEIVHSAFIIAAVLQGAIWIRTAVLGLVEHRAALSQNDQSSLSSALGLIRLLVSVAVFAIAAVLILDNLGVNVTGLVAGLGIGGIAIGLAAQGIFSDLFAALSIIFDKPFKIGDAITYSGKEGPVTGTVEKIGLKSTRIRSLTGELRVIGNAQLLAQEVTNYAGRSVFRLHLPVGVIYQTSPDVAKTIPEIMKQSTEEAGQRFVRASFTGFGPSSIDFELYFEADVEDIVDAQNAYQDVALDILRAFHSRGIEFAYPTQTNFTAAPDGRMILPYANVDI